MMAEGKDKLNIRLHVYDTEIPVYNIIPEEEPFYRNAAKLITETVNTYSERFRSTKSEKEILYMAMINIALNLEFEKTNNDTAPYDDILTKITNEIEDALGVSETGMRAATDKNKSENINIIKINNDIKYYYCRRSTYFGWTMRIFYIQVCSYREI